MNYIEHLINVEAPLVLDSVVPESKPTRMTQSDNIFVELEDPEDKKDEDSPPRAFKTTEDLEPG